MWGGGGTHTPVVRWKWDLHQLTFGQLAPQNWQIEQVAQSCSFERGGWGAKEHMQYMQYYANEFLALSHNKELFGENEELRLSRR